jgi:putative salt-induced outer membrane protein YdiY
VALAKNWPRCAHFPICNLDSLTLTTRSIIGGIIVLGALYSTGSSSAQSAPEPTLASPAPTVTPSAAQTAEAPSEPWKPPAGAASASLLSVAPEAELPLPGMSDQAGPAATADPASKVIFGDSEGTWHMPQGWFGPSPWDSGVELGLNGSSGTSDSFSIRSGAYMKRESRFSKLDFDTNYNLTTGDGKTAQNNAQLDLTNDWLINEKSPWTLFAKSNLFYDKFATFDFQTNLNMGIGYRWIHSPELDLMSRVGAGAEREFGGEKNAWVPESLVGIEYGQRVTKTQKVYAKVDYFPEWEQIGEFRAVADAGWEIELTQPSNLSLKLSASDRYDSIPDGTNPHLLNYSVLLLLKL